LFTASSPLYYITALTALFEAIARIVDQHAPVVEKYYGPGKMAAVIRRLLQEGDRVVKGLIDNWAEERGMQRKVTSPIAVPHFALLQADKECEYS
jgi:conserved oligomeric Golgi complex subunit 4